MLHHILPSIMWFSPGIPTCSLGSAQTPSPANLLPHQLLELVYYKSLWVGLRGMWSMQDWPHMRLTIQHRFVWRLTKYVDLILRWLTFLYHLFWWMWNGLTWRKWIYWCGGLIWEKGIFSAFYIIFTNFLWLLFFVYGYVSEWG